jgi:catechol 2,3-dioxygenase-like lactoylglutathione lyase family enzyme
MEVRRVLETCLYAQDLAESARFYERVLGLRVHSRVEGRHAFFRCGDAMFLLFDPARTSEPAGSVPPHGARGAGHVAFAVADADIGAWREHLGRCDVEIESEVEWPAGGRSLYLRDPAGNSVELASPRMWSIAEDR